jgi:hypothetical protein
MRKYIVLALFYVVSCINSFAGMQILPDDKIDNASEVSAVNSNFSQLSKGKLDLKPGDIIPRTDSFYSLGALGTEWKAIFVDSITATSLNTTAVYTSTFTCSSCTFTSARVINTLTGNIGTFSGALAGATLDTGLGANELYAMDQNVRTTDKPTFAGAIVTSTFTLNSERFFAGRSGAINNNATDTLFSLVATGGGNVVILDNGSGTVLAVAAFAFSDFSPNTFWVMSSSGSVVINRATVDLGGTTGIAGQITLSGHDNIVEIENRSGGTIAVRFFWWLF